MIIKKRWGEIDVETFMELKTISSEEYDTYFSNKLEHLAILSDTLYNDDVWGDMDCDEIEKLYDEVSFIKTSPNKNYQHEIGLFKYKGIRNITFGEYVDLNYWFSEGYYINLDKILSLLYRRYKYDEYGRLVFEDYSFDINDRKLLFHNIIINDVYGVVEEFIKFKKEIESNYSFWNNVPDGEEDDSNLSIEEKMELKKEIEEEEKQLNWVWESIAYNLAGEDISKMKDIFNLKVIFVFNMIEYKQSR